MNEIDSFCFRQESERLMKLCMAQMQLSLQQSDKEVEKLTSSFQELANICPQLETTIKQLNLTEHIEIDALHEKMRQQVNQSIVAFQFYDRLSQQLNYVINNLELLSQLTQDNTNLADESKWLELRTHVLKSYSMESEHLIFQAIMAGKDVPEAIQLQQTSSQPNDDIELF
ncbi:hypothetical protein ORJ66_06995 [Pseudoalteromonas tunicata]|uniref:hypothetical protein n=1 Tax=Pseudoalteromonas tunicata TaxID=314281 RepID=UPI00273DF1BD|nr:hypothetical protein [Pseudoalteromonas tunicata]MDP5212788.1 hypothetical protein [Pseudoalteromonas tunicata]